MCSSDMFNKEFILLQPTWLFVNIEANGEDCIFADDKTDERVEELSVEGIIGVEATKLDRGVG